MKTLLLLLLPLGLLAQVQPPECSIEGGDTIAPTFEMPYYLADSIYPSFDDVPELYNQPGTAIADIVFETLEDNCMMVYWPPCWCSATMSSSVTGQGDDWITYGFTAYDADFNFNSQDITFYWLEDFVDGIKEQSVEPLLVYPNPSDGTFIINKPYTIRDLMGRVREQPLPSGIYIITSGKERVKLIVN